MAHSVRAYLAVSSYIAFRDLEYFHFLLDGMLVHHRVNFSSKFACTHIYTWVKRGTVRVKCLAQEHNAAPRPGPEPRPLDPQLFQISSTLTIRPLCVIYEIGTEVCHGYILTTMPGHVGVSTKYVIPYFNNRHCWSLSITIAVECGGS